MMLGDLVESMKDRSLVQDDDLPEGLPVTAVVTDSRKVTPGSLFCAIRGTAVDGHQFLAEAAEAGAAAALVEVCDPSLSIPQVRVTDGRVAAAVAAASWYGWPGRALRIVGVTGTNGKSTTVALIRHLLNESADVGVLGTLGAIDGRGEPVEGWPSLTTPGPIELQSALRRLNERKLAGAVMEVSSHALDQHRVDGIEFEAVVFTNVTHEHLDYHRDVEEYKRVKFRLADYVKTGGCLVLNADAPVWNELTTPSGTRRIEFGRAHGAEVRAVNVQLGPRGSHFVLDLSGDEHRVDLPLLGEFNVSNALAAAAVGWSQGRSGGDIAERLADAPQVPGRMEKLYQGEFLVIRDYAHTPDAFDRALRALRPVTAGRLVILFGCGGDRDRDKRPVMGRVAAELADVVILSTDNPRSEDPMEIIEDIAEGLGGHRYLAILDREEAIHRALDMARSDDCILLAGKGHETYQDIGSEKLPFDEKSIVTTAMGKA